MNIRSATNAASPRESPVKTSPGSICRISISSGSATLLLESDSHFALVIMERLDHLKTAFDAISVGLFGLAKRHLLAELSRVVFGQGDAPESVRLDAHSGLLS